MVFFGGAWPNGMGLERGESVVNQRAIKLAWLRRKHPPCSITTWRALAIPAAIRLNMKQDGRKTVVKQKNPSKTRVFSNQPKGDSTLLA